MVDTLTVPERSRRMGLIRSSNTVPELTARHFLHAAGLRYRLNNKHLPGKPDLIFPRFRVAMFVHGCFWHRHQGCKVASTPKSNTEFWQEKFSRNVERDIKMSSQLEALGWRVIVLWECELKEPRVTRTMETAISWIQNGASLR